jgi:hypothetical protein
MPRAIDYWLPILLKRIPMKINKLLVLFVIFYRSLMTFTTVTRPQNKSGRYTSHHDRCIINFAGQDGRLAGHVLTFSFAPILSEHVQV